MELFDTCVEGLTLVVEDTRATYTKQDGGELLLDGEADGGEAWLNGKWYWWERDESAGEVRMGTEDSDEAVYTFEESEEGWANFANEVL